MVAPETVPVTPRATFEFNVLEAGVTVIVGVSNMVVVTVTWAVLLAALYTTSPA
jgi:hypothetical protein